MLIKILLKFDLMKLLDRLATGVFVVFFGTLWLFTTKYYVQPEKHSIVVHDVFGREIAPHGLKTMFDRKDIASSFIKEYQKSFPQYSFNFASYIPEVKRKTVFHRISNHK